MRELKLFRDPCTLLAIEDTVIKNGRAAEMILKFLHALSRKNLASRFRRW
jgi:hypothetical protein